MMKNPTPRKPVSLTIYSPIVGIFVLETFVPVGYSFLNQVTRRQPPQGQLHHRYYGSQDVRV
jgi:hypothetical protein